MWWPFFSSSPRDTGNSPRVSFVCTALALLVTASVTFALAESRERRACMTNYIVVTGGVVSSLGKGVTAAALGRLLKSRGVTVSIQKLDPYLNVDPGTMSPYQHGEVFVTEDGAETDLDLGHYERFIDENLSRASNVTSGQILSLIHI